ncbi:GGDEF domain-containing protein [Alkalisalibacterium limincola]|uniref:diguanylate cyclase n=1 Tax=Alkalisalibacterium limincola TaxID=2699169 RepID=A0A5C8KZ42_9GAMM|nr:GGDEF domain-containing protein [Alkalisalibacterium limincola]TXK64565.1 GGDEF domain-containing protein [Alkalisalibacterium limincola]
MITPTHDFRACARESIAYLRARLAFDLVMVTHVEGNDWIVLDVEATGYDVKAGDILKWDESFCIRMLDGRGPRVAPDARAVGAYRGAAIADRFEIGAYVGIPLVLENGHLFGTLCGLNRRTAGHELLAEQPTLELIGRLLSGVLQAELKAGRASRQAERYREEALSDVMTGLNNRRGWDLLLAAEDERCARYGYNAAVLVMDLDELKSINDTRGHAAGDELIRRAGSVLEAHARENDIIARLGGDEFGLIVAEADAGGLDLLTARYRQAFERAGIAVSIGAAVRDHKGGLREAWTQADALMYLHKRTEAMASAT